MLYGPAISQSDCRKAGPYQLPYNKVLYYTLFHISVIFRCIKCAQRKSDITGTATEIHLSLF